MARSARALVVELVADVGDFVKGTQKADDALQDFVSDTETGVRDINTAAAKLGDNIRDPFEKVGTSAKDAADDAERHFDNLAREAKTSFKKVETAADDAADGVGKESFGEAGKEAGAEFASNLGESLASGDISGVLRDTAGGLVSAFAGLAGPVGIGLAAAAATATVIFGKIQAEAERRAARIASVTGAIFDQMSADMQSAIGEFIRGQAYQTFVEGFSKDGDLNEGFREMGKLAKAAGVNVGDIANAFIQGGPAADAMRAKLGQVETTSRNTKVVAHGTVTEYSDAAKAAGTLKDRLSEAETSTANAAASAHLMWESMIGATEQSRQYELNMQNAARASGTIRQNQAGRAAAGTVTGGRARL